MKMAHKTPAHWSLSGYILLGLVMYVSATCTDLEQCFTNAGSTLPDGTSYKEVIDSFCKTKDALVNCYDKMRGCASYTTYLNALPDKAQVKTSLDVLCKYKDKYYEALECTIDGISAIPQSDIQAAVTCTQELLKTATMEQINKDCSLVEKLIKCDPATKVALTCSVELMTLMHDNGVDVPCISVYKALSSGSRSGACPMILLACFLIAVLSKLMRE